jgi:hypothetical protein
MPSGSLTFRDWSAHPAAAKLQSPSPPLQSQSGRVNRRILKEDSLPSALQEWGKHAWDSCRFISPHGMSIAPKEAEARSMSFSRQIRPVDASGEKYLRAMFGPGPHRSGVREN